MTCNYLFQKTSYLGSYFLTTYLPKVIKIPRASWYRAKKAPWDLEKKHTKEVIKVHEVKVFSCSKKGREGRELCGWRLSRLYCTRTESE